MKRLAPRGRPHSLHARLLRLLRTFSALDASLVARALGRPVGHVSTQLARLVHEGLCLRAPRRSSRRPRCRVEYHREIR